jgi:hypothetical protein
MSTHLQKLMTIYTLIVMLSGIVVASMRVVSPASDVRVFVTLPSSPDHNDGIIDLWIQAGTAPYYITYAKDDGSGNFVIVHEVMATNNGDEDYLNARVGTYKVSITDAYCAHLILDVVISFDCPCELPVLIHDPVLCNLSWDTPCVDNQYTYALQTMEGGQWVDIINPDNPHHNLTIGDYRLAVSKSGCATVYSDPVSVSCSPNQECVCTPPQLQYSHQECNLTWDAAICPLFSTVMEYKVGNGQWSTLGQVSSPYTIAANGDYRLRYQKTDCTTLYSNAVSATCSDENPVSSGSLSIQAIAQGCQGIQELIVLQVTGDTPYVDVSGLIIDDNNHLSFHQGNESGHIRLGDCFSEIAVGTMIFLYDSRNPFPGINPEDDGYSEPDGIFQLPLESECIVKYPSCPNNHEDDTSYDCAPSHKGTWRSLIPLYNVRDVVQVRNPDGSLIEAVVYGDALFNSNGGNVTYIPNSSNMPLLYKEDGIWYATDPCNEQEQYSNDPDNTVSLQSDIPSPNGLVIQPNPSSSYIDIIASKVIEKVSFIDVTGKLCLSLTTDTNAIYDINVDNIPAGIYIVKINYLDDSTEHKKFLKIN